MPPHPTHLSSSQSRRVSSQRLSSASHNGPGPALAPAPGPATSHFHPHVLPMPTSSRAAVGMPRSATPPSSRSAQHSMSSAATQVIPSSPLRVPTPSSAPALPPPVLFGLDGPLQQLKEAVGAATGSCMALVVGGGQGVGKVLLARTLASESHAK